MNLVTYGTLMAPDIMREVSGCSLESTVVVLNNYQRYGVQGEQYPGMIKIENERMEGVLYLDVPPEAIVRLDIFEGDMYSRESVSVLRKADGVSLDAMAYVVKPEYECLLIHEVWDFQNFLTNGKQLFEDKYSGFDELEQGQ